MEKRSRNSLKTVASILFVAAIVLSIGLVYIYVDRQKLLAETSDHSQVVQMAMTDSLSDATQQLMDLDNRTFSGQYQEALRGYRHLLEQGSPLPENIIRNRIAYIRNLTELPLDTLGLEADAQANFIMDSLNVLHGQIEDLRLAYGQSSDSLRNRINELSRQVHMRNKVLEQKDQLQLKEIKNAEGATIHYLGQTADGRANGTGTGLWESSGGVYKGHWRDNQRHGYGSYTWSGGEKYEGAFINDKREGHGTYTWPSGERYEGMWKDNKRHGKGTLYDPDGNISYEGGWEDDKPQKG